MDNKSQDVKSVELLNKVAKSTSRLASAFEKISSKYTERVVFYKSKVFWSVLFIAGGALTAFLNWDQEINILHAAAVRDEISELQGFRKDLLFLLESGRIIVYNQTLDCPTNDISLLRKYKKERGVIVAKIAGGISSSSLGLTEKILPYVEKFNARIFNLSQKGICGIDAAKFDNLQKQEVLKVKTTISDTMQRIRKEPKSS